MESNLKDDYIYITDSWSGRNQYIKSITAKFRRTELTRQQSRELCEEKVKTEDLNIIREE